MGLRAIRTIEFAAVLLVSVLLPLAIARLEAPLWFLPLAALAGWTIADLASGLMHWVGDSFGSERTPFLGAAFIQPFREHHDDPRAMTRHDFGEVNGTVCLGCVPILLLETEPFLHALLVFTALGAVLANQCHKWAHMASVPAAVRLAQRLGLILSPDVHRLHHRRPHDTHYCTASGWLNAPFNALLKALR